MKEREKRRHKVREINSNFLAGDFLCYLIMEDSYKDVLQIANYSFDLSLNCHEP
jgi:hypothetical protein